MTTIYVAQPQTELKLRSRQLQVFHKQQFCFAVPLSRVNQIIILGQHPWAQKAVSLALSLQIPVVYFEPNGQCIEYLNPSALPARHQKKQWQRSRDAEFCHSTAESLVRAKLHNACVLLRQLSDRTCPATVQQVLTLLQRLTDDLPLATSLAQLKSYEATGSDFYRAALNRFLPESFRHHNQGIRPIRRLTDLGVALLSQRIQILLRELGLDPDIANLHLDAFPRPPLVCDFLTELHIPVVDSLVMELLCTQQIKPEDFIWFEQGIFLSPAALEAFIQSWDTKLASPVIHLYVGEITYQQCLEQQTQAYLACLLEEQGFYKPMLLKQ